MAEKKIVYKVPEEVRKQSIETLKVRKKTLNIYSYLMFGIED